MLRGFYTAASGMLAQQRHQEALGNNIANMNTPGYKADQATIRSFPEMLIHAQGSKKLSTGRNVKIPTNQMVGTINTGVYVQEYVPNITQGGLRETGMETDFALVQTEVPDENGGLFFRVQNAEGEERLTRNGNFTIDGEGYLVTTQGFYVLDSAGEPINTGGREFLVTDQGIVQTATGSTPLGIAYVANVHNLIKEGDNLYTGEAAQAPAGTQYKVHQGFLENSNVDAARTMTEMMNAYRMFELNQRVLKAYDESLGKAVSEIGRIG